MSGIFLKIKNLSKRFGNIKVLDGLTLEYADTTNGIHLIFGPNSSGKTTLLNIITGYTPKDSGSVSYKPAGGNTEMELTRLKPHRIALMGIGRTFQDPRIFRWFTLKQSLELAIDNRPLHNPIAALYHYWKGDSSLLPDDLKILAEGLIGPMDMRCGTLSYGKQKLLGLLMAIARDPEIRFLDEPLAALSPDSQHKVLSLLNKECDAVTVVVEHHLKAVISVVNDVTFLSEGAVQARGTPSEVMQDQALIKDYTGISGQEAIERKAGPLNAPVLMHIAGLSAGYRGKDVFEDLVLDIREGEIILLLGSNGSGKSTLLKTLAGVLPASKGSITLNVKERPLDVHSMSVVQRVNNGIVYLPQHGDVFSNLTIMENLCLAAGSKQTAEQAFEWFPQLKEFRKQRSGLLSTGWRKALALAMIFLKTPKSVLLLDEPLEGLFPEVRASMAEQMVSMLRAQRTSAVIVDHGYEVLLPYVDRVFFLGNGMIKEIEWECSEDGACLMDPSKIVNEFFGR